MYVLKMIFFLGNLKYIDDDFLWHDCCIFICCGGYKFLSYKGKYVLRNALSHKIALSIQMCAEQAIAASEKFCSTKSFMLRKIKLKSWKKNRIVTFFFGQAMKKYCCIHLCSNTNCTVPLFISKFLRLLFLKTCAYYDI